MGIVAGYPEIMYKLRFHPRAVEEIENSLQWYGDRSKKAEKNLKRELNKNFQSILSFPLSFPIRYKSFRSCALQKFPYLIVYSVQSDVIFVVAFFHTSQNPATLKKRIR